MGGTGTPPTSPHIVYDAPDTQGLRIRLTVTFDAAQTLTGATVYRDAACRWTRVLIGLGDDGTPDSTPHAIPVPAGSTNLGPGQLSAAGLHTLADMIGLYQVTAAP